MQASKLGIERILEVRFHLRSVPRHGFHLRGAKAITRLVFTRTIDIFLQKTNTLSCKVNAPAFTTAEFKGSAQRLHKAIALAF